MLGALRVPAMPVGLKARRESWGPPGGRKDTGTDELHLMMVRRTATCMTVVFTLINY